MPTSDITNRTHTYNSRIESTPTTETVLSSECHCPHGHLAPNHSFCCTTTFTCSPTIHQHATNRPSHRAPNARPTSALSHCHFPTLRKRSNIPGRSRSIHRLYSTRIPLAQHLCMQGTRRISLPVWNRHGPRGPLRTTRTPYSSPSQPAPRLRMAPLL